MGIPRLGSIWVANDESFEQDAAGRMSASQFQPGFRVGRYELLAPIASGGMASVWAARIQGTRGFEKLVAIKTILPHLADDPQFETMFLDEARIASEIVHPNIAQVFDLGEQDGVLFLVCEWVDGESLATLRKRVVDQGQEIPIPIALRIMSDVCGGLHAAHELRDVTGKPLHVVHRDVSPQNIVISDAGAVKVIDFGVAKAQNRKLDQTVAGKLKGKVQYMPPEQARGLPVDRRTDLWSVGAVLYHLLAGRTPYEADSPLAVLNLLLSEEAPPPLPAHVPESVADIVFQALRPNPIERFQTAAEMQIAIAMALRNVSMPIPDAAIGEFVRRYVGAQAKQRHQLIAEAIEAANHAPPPPADLTLVEVVEAVEELAAAAVARVQLIAGGGVEEDSRRTVSRSRSAAHRTRKRRTRTVGASLSRGLDSDFRSHGGGTPRGERTLPDGTGQPRAIPSAIRSAIPSAISAATHTQSFHHGRHRSGDHGPSARRGLARGPSNPRSCGRVSCRHRDLCLVLAEDQATAGQLPCPFRFRNSESRIAPIVRGTESLRA